MSGSPSTFRSSSRRARLDAEKAFLGLKDTETADAYRLALINVVAEMVTREPLGFDDLPGSLLAAEFEALSESLSAPELEEATRGEITGRLDERQRALAEVRRTPLAERVRLYFDEPQKPEFEAILLSVWRAYKATAIPSAYIKSLPRHGEGSQGVSPPA